MELIVLYWGIFKFFILLFMIVVRFFVRILFWIELYLICCSFELNVFWMIFLVFFGMNILFLFGFNWYVFFNWIVGLFGVVVCWFFFLVRCCYVCVVVIIWKKVMLECLGVGFDFLDREFVDRVWLWWFKLLFFCLFLF